MAAETPDTTAGEQPPVRKAKLARPRRARPQVDYAEPVDELDELGAAPQPIAYQRLSEAITHGSFADVQRRVQPKQLTAELLKKDGFRQPVLAKGGSSAAETLKALDMRLPKARLSAQSIAAAVGPSHKLHTIDVVTQAAGPRLSMQQWQAYFGTPAAERTSLLNVVSLPLADTALADVVVAPAAVRQIDLIARVWPREEEQRPEVLLYALMSPEGAFTDFHCDFGGSAVWYHVISGCKTFLMVPPTAANMLAFEEWASSAKQASLFFGDRADGCVRCELSSNDTLLIPSGWPHAVVTSQDSVVVGGNFLHGFDFRQELEVWEMEGRLGVQAQFRFPLYKQLLWHAAVYYLGELQSIIATGCRTEWWRASWWELDGLTALVGALKRWCGRRSTSLASVPESIEDPQGMLRELAGAISDAELESLQAQLKRELELQARGKLLSYTDDRGHKQGLFTLSHLKLLHGSHLIRSSTLDGQGGGCGQPGSHRGSWRSGSNGQVQRAAAEIAAAEGNASQPRWTSWRQKWTADATARLEAQVKQMMAEVEAEEEDVYEGLWTFTNAAGEDDGPYSIQELRDLLDRGEITSLIMVHDEEDGVSIQLSTLLANHRTTHLHPVQRALAAAAAAPPAVGTTLPGLPEGSARPNGESRAAEPVSGKSAEARPPTAAASLSNGHAASLIRSARGRAADNAAARSAASDSHGKQEKPLVPHEANAGHAERSQRPKKQRRRQSSKPAWLNVPPRPLTPQHLPVEPIAGSHPQTTANADGVVEDDVGFYDGGDFDHDGDDSDGEIPEHVRTIVQAIAATGANGEPALLPAASDSAIPPAGNATYLPSQASFLPLGPPRSRESPVTSASARPCI
ncbi:hypothetical protein WJX72_005043 [[Myrmecia] bisecta]|uniref:JmjC domain-containing protein n=1 Tax=[Myrmecia] bisecta TaxID=41462 RepID=A0AAW1P927_9CHLO